MGCHWRSRTSPEFALGLCRPEGEGQQGDEELKQEGVPEHQRLKDTGKVRVEREKQQPHERNNLFRKKIQRS